MVICEYSDEEVIASCQDSMRHDFIMDMEDGYQTEVNERAAALCRSEIALSASCKSPVENPAILILDEATFSIDTETRILLQKGFE